MATVVPLLLLLVAMVRALPSAPPVALPLPAASAATSAALPEAFDARSLVFGCADTILDQGLCGSCWAFSVTGALTDRYCIWSGGQLFGHTSADDSASLSPQPLLSCGVPVATEKHTGSFGCDGGSTQAAWEYFQANGSLTCRRQQTQAGVTCDSGCAPYTSGACAMESPYHPSGCVRCSRDLCSDGNGNPTNWSSALWANMSGDSGAPHMNFFAHSNGAVGVPPPPPLPQASPPPATPPVPDVKAIMREIATNGPVSTCFHVYDDFTPFFVAEPAGIYNQTNSSVELGGHCVKLVGWGHDQASSIDYWLVANSWSTNWGTHGYFRFSRGKNLANIEGSVWAGCPPPELSLGTSSAPGAQCQLTAPDSRRRRTGALPATTGGGWIEHDIAETLLDQRGSSSDWPSFVRLALHTFEEDAARKVAALLPPGHALATRHGRATLIRQQRDGTSTNVSRWVRVRTQVTRGIHVRMELALDGGGRLEVSSLHDAVGGAVSVTHAQVLP